MALAAAGLLAASSAGQGEAPSQEAAAAISYSPPASVPAGERMRLRDGFAAAASGDWSGLAQLRDAASDPLVRRVLQWRAAIADDAPLSFQELAQALTELPGWPGRAGMRARAEQAIFDSRLSASERVAFLRLDGGPTTGDGRIALAVALKDLGRRSEAE